MTLQEPDFSRDSVGATGFEAAPESARNAEKNAVPRVPSPAPVAEPSRVVTPPQDVATAGDAEDQTDPLAILRLTLDEPSPVIDLAAERARRAR
jgi:hypothetical protein